MNPTVPPPLEALAADLRDLAKQARRAQLHALLPVVDELSRQGVPHESLAAKMSASGIPITAAALRKALSRWRKRQSQTRRSAPSSVAAATSDVRAPLPHPTIRSTPPGGISSKADLVRLRKSQEDIDLNQLAELSRQK